MLSLASVTLAFVSVACLGTPVALLQDEDDTFFSGTVEEVTPESIAVSREILGKPAERRTFAISVHTKVEGKLAEGVRVTVKFRQIDDGLMAETIIVRDPSKIKKKS
jgi:hypothetical protein